MPISSRVRPRFERRLLGNSTAGGPSRLMVRSNARQGRHQFSGDVSLTDVISRMKLLERADSGAPKITSGVAKSVAVNASSEGSSSG